MYVVRLGHQILALDVAALRIGRDLQIVAGHEQLGLIHERLHRDVGVETGRHLDRLAGPCHRRGQGRRHDPDPLAGLLVVSPAAKPRQPHTFGRKRLGGLVQQACMRGKAEPGLKDVAGLGTVGLPIDVAGPISPLDPVVTGCT